MIDIINDISIPEDSGATRRIDVRTFFSSTQVHVVSHNSLNPFHDIKPGVGSTLNVALPIQLRLKKSKNPSLEDLFSSRKYRSTFFSFIQKNRIIRLNPISIISPLAPLPFNSLDVRPLEVLPFVKMYSDIYAFPPPLRRRVKRYLRKHRKRIAIGGVVFASLSISLVLLSLTAKSYIEHETIKNYNRIAALKDIRDMNHLSQEVHSIRNSFEITALIFSPFRLALDNRFYVHPSVHLAGNVIHGGLNLSLAMEQGLSLAQEFTKELPKSSSGELLFDMDSLAKSNLKVTDFLKKEKEQLETMNMSLADSLNAYAQIDSLGNKVLDEKLQKNIQTLLGVKQILAFSLDNFDNVLRMLGDTKPERYMIINQNRDELRANGGFPGSILSFELYKGRVQKFERRDVYDYDWKLYPYKEAPPSGLEGYSDNFGIRDANYYPDFRDSVQKIGFFVEKAGYTSVDTMIAINQGIVIDFLKKYGPIKLPEYNLTIDANNFSRVVSTLVEARVFPYKKLDTAHSYQSPKEFLFRFMEAFSKNLAEKRDIFGYLTILSEHFRSHEILIASNNADTEQFLENLGTMNVWQKDEGNWIYPIFTSLSANKSDRYMNRKMVVRTKTLSGCLVHNDVTLDSEHAITVDENLKTRKLLYDFGIIDPKEQERLVFIEGNGANKQYIRFLVPKDSILDTGSDMKTESSPLNYTIFSAFGRTEPMKSSSLRFGYITKVPNCVPTMNSYKQPGVVNMTISLQ